MLIKHQVLELIADGTVNLAFRRWKRPTVRAGGSLRTAIGVLGIDAVDRVSTDEITEEEAQRAGYSSRADLLHALNQKQDGTIYRIQLHFAGHDPRQALRGQTSLTDEELSQVRQKLVQFDSKSRDGPWTMTVLNLIGKHPEVRAAELATLASLETPIFKAKVRKLKELGLTESIAKGGYRLSPRGREVLKSLDAK